MKYTQTVLLYINKGDEYLLLHRTKKKNDYNANKYIGIGGHIEEGETKEDALIRETKEETGLDLIDFEYKGIILFCLDDLEETMHLFTSSSFKGNLIDCDEGDLVWVNKNDIFSLNLYEGDKLFLKDIFENKKSINYKLVYRNDKLIEAIKK